MTDDSEPIPDPTPEPAPTSPRTRRAWIVAAAVAAIAVVAVAAVVLLRDNEPRQSISPPTSEIEHETTLQTTTSTIPDSVVTVPQTAAPATTTVATTTPTTLPADGEGFVPACVPTTANGSQPPRLDEAKIDSFGPLASDPTLTIQLPLGISPSYPEPLAPMSFPLRVPSGVLLPIRSSTTGSFNGSMLAVVDTDGSTRWVRCDGPNVDSVLVASASDLPTQALAIVSSNGVDYEQVIISLADGATVGTLRELMSSQGLDPTMPFRGYPLATSDTSVVFGPPEGAVYQATDQLILLDLRDFTIELIPIPPQMVGTSPPYSQFRFTDDGELALMGRDDLYYATAALYTAGGWTTDEQVLAGAFPIGAEFEVTTGELFGFDAVGNVVWRNPEIVTLMGEGFRTGRSNDVIVVSGCSQAGCDVDWNLYGVDAATGQTLWTLDGQHAVSAVGNGYALVTDFTSGWQLIDTDTGRLAAPGQEWADPTTFEQQCCGGGESVHVSRFGGVVVAVHETRVTVWYPKSISLAPAGSVAIP